MEPIDIVQAFLDKHKITYIWKRTRKYHIGLPLYMASPASDVKVIELSYTTKVKRGSYTTYLHLANRDWMSDILCLIWTRHNKNVGCQHVTDNNVLLNISDPTMFDTLLVIINALPEIAAKHVRKIKRTD